jgi:hypothetical protein
MVIKATPVPAKGRAQFFTVSLIWGGAYHRFKRGEKLMIWYQYLIVASLKCTINTSL